LLQHNKKGNDSKGSIAIIAFFLFSCSVAKKVTTALLPSCSSFFTYMAFFCFHFATTKKATAMSRHLLLGFRCSEEEEDENFCHLLQWLCYKNNGDLRLFWWFYREEGDDNNVVAFLYGDGSKRFCFFFLVLIV